MESNKSNILSFDVVPLLNAFSHCRTFTIDNYFHRRDTHKVPYFMHSIDVTYNANTHTYIHGKERKGKKIIIITKFQTNI